jgi:hypothetical protein
MSGSESFTVHKPQNLQRVRLALRGMLALLVIQALDTSAAKATNQCHPSSIGGCNVCKACCNDYIPIGKECDGCAKAKCAAHKTFINEGSYDTSTLKKTEKLGESNVRTCLPRDPMQSNLFLPRPEEAYMNVQTATANAEKAKTATATAAKATTTTATPAATTAAKTAAKTAATTTAAKTAATTTANTTPAAKTPAKTAATTTTKTGAIAHGNSVDQDDGPNEFGSFLARLSKSIPSAPLDVVVGEGKAAGGLSGQPADAEHAADLQAKRTAYLPPAPTPDVPVEDESDEGWPTAISKKYQKYQVDPVKCSDKV